MKRNVILTPEQRIKFDKLIAESKFNRLVTDLLANKTTSADEKSRLIYALKKKLFEAPQRKSRF
jgi:hypothetical protein